MTKTRLQHPITELLARYRAVFATAWQARHELAGPRRMSDEVAFLPAALSLQDTPVHPAPRRLAWALMLLFALVVLWACIGKIDIVATAPGRIVVSNGTKIIQPLETSVVRKVLVKDGDRVQVSQVLIELDPTNANADKANINEQLSTANSEVQRTSVLLKALVMKPVDMAVLTDTKPLGPQLLAEWQDINAKLSKLDAEASRRKAETATVRQVIAKLQATLPIAVVREKDFERLVKEGFISSHATQDKARDRLELERDLATQNARLAEADASLKEAEQTKAAFLAETQRTLNDRHAAAMSKAQQLNQEYAKATQREQLTHLTAPVAGTVQQLAVHSVGGVVTSAQQLMIVVPDAAQVTAEVNITNLDIGFVNTGQAAEVKLETFAYTKYGTVLATLAVVGADAVTDEKKGSYYPATLTLSQRTMNIDGKQVPISPGMNVTAEIKTGQRRIIEYLLSPIQRAGNESLRER